MALFTQAGVDKQSKKGLAAGVVHVQNKMSKDMGKAKLLRPDALAGGFIELVCFL